MVRYIIPYGYYKIYYDLFAFQVSPKSTYSDGSPVSTRSRRRTNARSTQSPGSSSTVSTRTPGGRSNHSGRSPANVSVLSKKGMTPRGKRGLTPSSLRKILSKGKSPWRKLENEAEVRMWISKAAVIQAFLSTISL